MKKPGMTEKNVRVVQEVYEDNDTVVKSDRWVKVWEESTSVISSLGSGDGQVDTYGQAGVWSHMEEGLGEVAVCTGDKRTEH